MLTLSIACCRWLLGSGHCSLLPLPPPWLPVNLVQISVLMASRPVPTPYIIELEMGVFGGNQNRAWLLLLHDFLQEVLQLAGDGLVEDHLLTSSCDVEVEHCEVYHYSRCSRPSRPISTENIADPCDLLPSFSSICTSAYLHQPHPPINFCCHRQQRKSLWFHVF